MALTPQEQNFINGKVDAALERAGLPHDSPVRALLACYAKVVSSGRDFYVTVWQPDGDISLEQRVDQLRSDPKFQHHFGEKPTEIASRDLQTLGDHFNDIVSGRAVVR